MRVSDLIKTLDEYRPSARLIVTVDSRIKLETTVLEFQLRLQEMPADSGTFLFGKNPSILRERRADVTLGLMKQMEMRFKGPYEAEWLELECR